MTTCEIEDDVLELKAPEPANCALIECLAALSFEVAKVATPLARVPVPITVLPSRKLMLVPSGGAPPFGPPLFEVTVAVKITVAPNPAGLADETSETALLALMVAMIRIFELLVLFPESPAYTACTVRMLTLVKLVVRVATPAFRLADPSTVLPDLKLTVPVGVPLPEGVTVAVSVTV